jgi:uncharacterized membrane protein YkvA (DUF1232 family)
MLVAGKAIRTVAIRSPAMASERWKARADVLRREAVALFGACRDPRSPWYARALGIAVSAYAVSPIDLIPDFIPVLGLLDDLVIVPLGLLGVRALIPGEALAEHRARAGLVSEPRC